MSCYLPELGSAPTADAQLRELLRRLEILDCGCPVDRACPCGEGCEPGADCPHCRGECDCPPAAFQPPCRHTAERDHSVSVEEWAQLLLLAYPEDYAEPRIPRSGFRAALVVSVSSRVDVMAKRRRAGLPLYHPDDLWRQDEASVGAVVGHLRNGDDCERGVA